MKLTRLLLLSCLASFSIGAYAQEGYAVKFYVPGEDVITTNVSSKEDLEYLLDNYYYNGGQNTIAVFEDQIPDDWASLDNVVSNGKAKKIVLTNEEPYTYVGDAFVAEKVEFIFNFERKAPKRRFEDKSELNLDYPPHMGWYSLAIPFTGVSEIPPLTNNSRETGKFFVKEFNGANMDGPLFRDLENPVFEAHHSYILAFPDDSYGANEFQRYDLLISAENVTVSSSESVTIERDSEWYMTTTYNGGGRSKSYFLDKYGIKYNYQEEDRGFPPFTAYLMSDFDFSRREDRDCMTRASWDEDEDILIHGEDGYRTGGYYLTLALNDGDDACYARSVTLPTLDDDSFLGWATSATGPVVYDGGTTIDLSSDRTLYPKYGSVITLSDMNDVSALSEVDGQTKNVRLKRTFPQGKKQTICLPFNPSAILENGTVWEFTGIEDGKAVMTQCTGSLSANKPYIFEASSDLTSILFKDVDISIGNNPKTVDATSGFTFHGTYTKKHWDADHSEVVNGTIYGFMAEDNDGQTTGDFVRARRATDLRPFSCYLEYNDELSGIKTTAATRGTTLTGGLPDVIGIEWKSGSGSTTAIDGTRAAEVPGRLGWWSLDGRKLADKPRAKGVYIHNGRKTVIK